MNSVQLIGRLTRDPEIRYTDGGVSIARFSLAVERRFKQENGADADFINIVSFGKTAEFIEKYFHKGMKVALNGRIQTGSYMDKDGKKVYTTDIVAENVEFCESKGTSANNDASAPSHDGDFMNVPDGIDEELPFN